MSENIITLPSIINDPSLVENALLTLPPIVKDLSIPEAIFWNHSGVLGDVKIQEIGNGEIIKKTVNELNRAWLNGTLGYKCAALELAEFDIAGAESINELTPRALSTSKMVDYDGNNPRLKVGIFGRKDMDTASGWNVFNYDGSLPSCRKAAFDRQTFDSGSTLAQNYLAAKKDLLTYIQEDKLLRMSNLAQANAQREAAQSSINSILN